MRSKQQGITFIGLLALAAMVGVLGFAGLKLVPAYLEHMKILRILNDVKADLDGQAPTPPSIRSAIDKRLNIEMVYGVKLQQFKIDKSEGGFTVAVRYDKAEPFIANVSLLVSFDNEVEIRQ